MVREKMDDAEIVLTPRELAIAARAADIAIERVYTEIGRSVVKKTLWLAGAGAVATFMWLKSHGLL